MKINNVNKRKASWPVIILRGMGLYAAGYACYWGAAYLVGVPHDFHHLWTKALILPGIAAAALYFNKMAEKPK